MPQTLQPLSPAGVKEAIEAGAVLVDTRPATVFTSGFVPGSISLGLNGPFVEWADAVLPRNTPLVLVTDDGQEEASAARLQEAGFTQVAGYLQGGFAAWQAAGEEADMIIDVEADELAMDLPFDENIMVLDVRQPTEWAEGHVEDAENIPLSELTDLANIASIEETQNVYIHCRSGYRSVVGASLMKRQGVHNLRNVLGGWNAIKAEPRIKTVTEKPGEGKDSEQAK